MNHLHTKVLKPIRSFVSILTASFFLVSCGGEGNQKTFKTGRVSGEIGVPNLTQEEENKAKSLFIVPPYLQPGNASGLSIEKKVLIWQTPDIPTSFKVEYGSGNEPRKILVPAVTPLQVRDKKTLLYRVELEPLRWGKEYHYSIVANDLSVFLGTFRTRTKESRFQFAVVGDTGVASPWEAKVCQQISAKQPDFLLHVGDFAYYNGTAEDYLEKAFPYFNRMPKTPGPGSELMQHIPTYLTFGNHDVKQSSDLNQNAGYNAGFYYFDLPLNGPSLDHLFQVQGSTSQKESFQQLAKGRFPKMADYSFDWGSAHFLVILGVSFVHPLEPSRLKWIEKDLSQSKAKWKFVSVHEPLFATKERYRKQGLRLLAPIFEKHHIDMVFSGHVHNYQRSKPLRFVPEAGHYSVPIKLVPGRFEIDQQFNGTSQTHPKGVIYLVSGAGGAPLTNKEATFEPKGWQPFTQKLIADRYSFTFVQVQENQLSIQQLDAEGKPIDTFHVTK